MTNAGEQQDSANTTDDPKQEASADSSTQQSPTATLAKQFVACLVSKGFDARVEGEKHDQVALLEIGWNGQAVQPVVSTDPDGTVNRDWSGDLAMYPHITMSGVEGDVVTGEYFPYVLAQNSSELADSPYADKQQDYAVCEAKYPAFTQAPPQSVPDQSKASEEDRKAVLAFARQARVKGFAWVADPSADSPLNIVIPTDVPREEVKRFLVDCPTDDTPVTIAWNGDYPYDINELNAEAQAERAKGTTHQQ